MIARLPFANESPIATRAAAGAHHAATLDHKLDGASDLE